MINGNLTPNGTHSESQRRVKSSTPSFDKFHPHQLSHIPATPLEPPPIVPFHRYQKSHRPPKYRSQTSLHRSAQSFHDAFQSSNYSHQSQPFLSFTESYLQKYADRSANKLDFTTTNDDIDESTEKPEEIEQKQKRSASAEPNLLHNQNKKSDHKSKTSNLQHTRTMNIIT